MSTQLGAKSSQKSVLTTVDPISSPESVTTAIFKESSTSRPTMIFRSIKPDIGFVNIPSTTSPTTDSTYYVETESSTSTQKIKSRMISTTTTELDRTILLPASTTTND